MFIYDLVRQISKKKILSLIVVICLFIILAFSPAGVTHFDFSGGLEDLFKSILYLLLFIASVKIIVEENVNISVVLVFFYFAICITNYFGYEISWKLFGSHNILAFFICFVVSISIIVMNFGGSRAVYLLGSICILVIFYKPLYYPVEVKYKDGNLEERGLSDPAPQSQCERGNAGCQFSKWLLNRPNLDWFKKKSKPYPVFMISASGGGIYAAGQSFNFLNAVQSECSVFLQHVFAISVVSGGAFGVLPFLEEKRTPKSVDSSCREMPLVPSNIISKDHLSYVVAGYVFGNVPNHFFGILNSKTSVHALEQSFKEELGPTISKLNVLDSWNYRENIPAIIFNVTKGGDSQPKTISPLVTTRDSFSKRQFSSILLNHGEIDRDINIVTAASLSARFPFLTPPGEFKPSEDEVVFLFDGGYFDNSGLSALRNVYKDIKSYVEYKDFEIKREISETYSFPIFDLDAKNCDFIEDEKKATKCNNDFISDIYSSGDVPVELHLIQLSNSSHGREKSKSYFFDPILQLLDSRGALVDNMVTNLIREDLECGTSECEDGYSGLIQHFIPAEKYKLPLSWTIGTEGNALLQFHSGRSSDCTRKEAKQAQTEERELSIKFNNGCTIIMIKKILEGKDDLNEFYFDMILGGI